MKWIDAVKVALQKQIIYLFLAVIVRTY